MSIFSRIQLIWYKLCFICEFGVKRYKQSHIYGPYKIVEPSNLKFGNSFSINDFVYINASGGVILGHNVVLSAGSKILSTGLVFEKKIFKYKKDKVVIKDNVQLGAGAIVLPGVEICSNIIVGAGALVTKNLEEPGVYVGQPARKIKDV